MSMLHILHWLMCVRRDNGMFGAAVPWSSIAETAAFPIMPNPHSSMKFMNSSEVGWVPKFAASF